MSSIVYCRDSSLREKVKAYKNFFAQGWTEAAHYVAKRAKNELDARYLGWTLDQLDEEGELVKFAAGIPGFSRSTRVEGAVSILEHASYHSTRYQSLYRRIVLLLIRASKPELLHDSKLLPEPVRQQRTMVCLEALYHLPCAIRKIMHRMELASDSREVEAGFSPIFQSTESWIVAERLSESNDRIDVDVVVGAQCMATIIASRLPDKQILMRHLKIKGSDDSSLHLEPFDGALLKNINQFLANTALKHIEDIEDFRIILSTLSLVKLPELKHVSKELNDEFIMLRGRISEHTTRLGSSEWASSNAKVLQERLNKLFGTIPPSATHLRAEMSSPSVSLDGPTGATLTPTSTPQTPESLSRLPLLPDLPRSNDAYISMDCVTSPMSPNDTPPMSP